MIPDINTALASVFDANGAAPCGEMSVRRRKTPYVTTFPCEIVSCSFPGGATLQLFCKYGAKGAVSSFGQRAGVAYEAEVYRHVLQPSGVSAPLFYGAYTDPGAGGALRSGRAL